MASIPTLPGTIPPMPAVARILARYDRPKLEAFLSIAIDLLDTLDPDPEAEPATWTEAIDARERDEGLPDDSEAVGDEADAAWIEWTAMRGSQKRGPNMTGGEEDDEEDDAPEDDDSDRCLAGEDWMHGGPALLADALGFTSTPSHYNVGMDEECEHNTAPCDIA